MQDADQDPERRLSALRDEHQRLAAELGALRRFLSSMRALVEAINTRRHEHEVLELLERVLDSALQAVDAEGGSLLVPDEQRGGLVFVLVRGEAAPAPLAGTRVPPGEGIASWAAREQRATIVNDTAHDERFYPEIDKRLARRTRSVLAAPIVGGGRLLAIVELVNRHGGKLFTLANQTLLSLMCRFAGELLNGLVKDIDLSQTIEQAAGRQLGAARAGRQQR